MRDWATERQGGGVSGRWVLVALVGLVLVGVLSGCGTWFPAVTRPTLYLGKPVITGNQGEISLLVSDMPGGGLSGIQVDLGGMTYNQEKILGIQVVGENGFESVFSSFAAGKAAFMLINNSSGVVNGVILKFTFTTNGNVKSGDIALFASQITLTSDTYVDNFDFRVPAYYAE